MKAIEKRTQERVLEAFRIADRIQNKTYGENCEGGKNRMAMAIMFDIWFSKLNHLCKKGVDNDEELFELNELLDLLLSVENCSDETRELFWKGEQPYKPDKFPFTNSYGKTEYINLNDVREVTIGNLVTKK